MDKMFFKCGCLNGPKIRSTSFSIVFLIDEAPSYKITSESETLHFGTTLKNSDNITLHLREDDRRRADFDGDIVTFTSVKKNIQYCKFSNKVITKTKYGFLLCWKSSFF